jgi:ADP-dependent NAD(P)H-hydrate dehydratase / NAD(P)H-hydrate epimerase
VGLFIYFSIMKIFTAAQIRACDAYTIKASAIRSADLMERAATRCVVWLKDRFQKDTLFVVLCGTGNNGGDGLAIARMLHSRGFGVKAFLLNFGKELSEDCKTNLQRLQQIDNSLVSIVQPDTFITDIPAHIVVIDAILGTGLSRPTQGWVASFIDHINHLPNKKIAIDIPSGLPADVIPDKGASVLKANDTLSFQFYKRTFLHPESAACCGNIHIIDIDLDKTFINATHSLYQTIEPGDAAAIYRPRNAFAHKGTHGSALMITGSYGKMGAALLSSKAALRAGAGLVTALIPGCGYTALQSAVPEAMCLIGGESVIENIFEWEHKTVVGIGPGIGTDTKTATAVSKFIDDCKFPVVADADALNIMAKHPDLLAKLPKGSVLTPHPKEFARLFGENTNTMIQVEHARIQAMRYNINIILKGHHTAVITTEGDCWYNMTGNAGMATGGSGDVLTGIITALIAQGYAPHNAAILGVYLHGLAGDLAAKDISQEALIAGDIIDYLGKAFLAFA